MTRSILILICSLVAAERGLAGTVLEKKDAAELEVRFEGDKPKLALSDLITVTLTVEGSSALDVYKAPRDLPGAAPWVLVERSGDSRETISKDKVRWRLVYRFAPREPGEKITFQFPDVTFRDGEGDDQTVSWTPIVFSVAAQVEPGGVVPRDITAIETLPPIAPIDRSLWWLAGIAAGFLLIAAILAIRLLVRRQAPRSPAQLALYEWDRLVAMKLPEKGRSERFITLLTMLVRGYLERQFALPARRRTTPEFMRNLDQAAALTAEEKQFLVQFLQRCEAVKFAQQAMSVEECAEWARKTREFLQVHVDSTFRA